MCACGQPSREGQRNCKECHAANMREWRRTHKMSPEQRKKDNCRSYANVYLRRDKLEKQPCEHCGHEHVEMHHEDYDKPLDVTWLCRPCHLAHHKGESNV